MARLKTILFFILLSYSYQLKAFGDSTLRLQLTKTIIGDYASFSVDNLGNIFLITTSNQIKKLNKQGRLISESRHTNIVFDKEFSADHFKIADGK